MREAAGEARREFLTAAGRRLEYEWIAPAAGAGED